MRRSLEADLQKAVVTRLTYLRNQNRLRFFAVPNGGTRHVREAVNLKAQGVVAGVPDLCVLVPSRPYVGVRAPDSKPRVIFLELKSPKGKLTDPQLDWAGWLTQSGFLCFVIRSLDELKAVLDQYIGGGHDPRGKAPALRAVVSDRPEVAPAEPGDPI